MKNQLKARYKPEHESTGLLYLHRALVGMGPGTKIESGENAGRNAKHEFVVLDYIQVDSSINHWQLDLSSLLSHETDQLAIVAWVSTITNPVPLQLSGGPYPVGH